MVRFNMHRNTILLLGNVAMMRTVFIDVIEMATTTTTANMNAASKRKGCGRNAFVILINDIDIFFNLAVMTATNFIWINVMHPVVFLNFSFASLRAWVVEGC